MNMININAINNINIPISDAIANGAVEKATIPSMLYNNNFQKDHFVSPATLSTFSNSIHFVLNPTQPNSPLLNDYILLILIKHLQTVLSLNDNHVHHPLIQYQIFYS